MVKKLLTKTNFPIKRFIGGAALAVIFVSAQLALQIANSELKIPLPVLLLSMLVPLVLMFAMGFIPMFMAFRKNKQHKEVISWLAFCAMFLPLNILFFLGALIWTLCDKPAGAVKD